MAVEGIFPVWSLQVKFRDIKSADIWILGIQNLWQNPENTLRKIPLSNDGNFTYLHIFYLLVSLNIEHEKYTHFF